MILESRKIIDKYKNLENRYNEIKSIFNIKSFVDELSNLQNKTLKEDFWEEKNKAQKILKKINYIETKINNWKKLDVKFEELSLFISLIEPDIDIDKDILDSIESFEFFLNKIEILNLLNSPNDHQDVILTIHSGAGGTDSQDWVSMLYRMYSRWCESNKYSSSVLSFQGGDEAGIKEVTIEIKGDYAYGYLKSEIGVHRLVRLSPFNSNSKRHTSFASVFISPIIDDDIVIDINENDIKIDTYRASGAGGQHVNKTDSAVRITHIPSGIVVQCQNQRSQLNNKNHAIKMLKSKLYQLHIEKLEKEKSKLSSEKKNISWGSQIRSYIFHPYNMIKDHRTKYEVSNVSKVMDGDLDLFIRSHLLCKMEKANGGK